MFCAIPTICFFGTGVLAVAWRFPHFFLEIRMRVRFGDCVLDTDTRELFRRDKPVHLPPKAFRVLELLVENRPRAVTKDEIHDKIWPGTYVS